MENQINERYEALKKEIAKCIDHGYELPKNVPPPFERSVLIKQLDQIEVKTESGLILGGEASARANNVMRPNVGIVVAVGPRVPDYIVPKLRVYFNQNIDLEYFIGGQFYKMSDWSDLYAGIPDNVLVGMDTKDDKQIMREKKMDQEMNYNLANKIREDEEKNRKELEAIAKKSKFKA